VIALTGIKNYSTFSPGIGGRIKKRIDDFKVEEISPDGKVCEIRAFAGIEKKELEKQWPENSEEREHLVLELEKFNPFFGSEQETHWLCRNEGQARDNMPAHFSLDA